MTYRAVEVHNHAYGTFPAVHRCQYMEKVGTIKISAKKPKKGVFVIIDGKRIKANVSPVFKDTRVIGYKVEKFGTAKVYWF